MSHTNEIEQLTAAGDFDTWIARLEDLGDARGYFEPLGKSHSAILTDEGPILLVTFESAGKILDKSQSHRPIGWEMVQDNGWSNLCLVAHEDSWFRDRSVYGYFDRLVDDGFFEDFDQVVFYGADMGGYAAAAYSVVAPGATAIVLAPQATLDARIAGWDRRFLPARRRSFSDRYGYAPDMIEALDRAWVLFDPAIRLDAMHASLFCRPNVTRLRCPHLGRDLEAHLWAMGTLPQIIEAAGNGTFDAGFFHRAFRARRQHMPYLRTLLALLENAQRPRLVRMLCNSVTGRMKAPRFAKARDRADEALATMSETTQ